MKSKNDYVKKYMDKVTRPATHVDKKKRNKKGYTKHKVRYV